MALELTRLSERGQIVIPTEIRKSMKLREGERFIVTGLGDTIILRKLELSKERLRLKRLIRESSEKARKSGFTKKEVAMLIEKARKISG
ncbi:MAG: AbrB/MazE/SpoVT family DNA-binding domain-containing protein [Nitrososphaerota archaeon]|nr:AbrB/MazE/SpoVT family DNA-binding domain-containing protein [Nitrososphaerota archaeon]